MRKREFYIEQVGLFYENYGLPRMAGRILGHLLSSESDAISFEELQKSLQASKGSISGNVNLLLNQKLIIKHTIPGDRKTYFTLSYNSLNAIIEEKAKSVTAFRKLFEKGIGFHTDQHTPKHEILSEIIHYYQFLEEEMPLLKKKWENKRKTIHNDNRKKSR